MTDLDRAGLDRILPSTTGTPDWDDVISRSGVHSARRHRLIVAFAAAALLAALTASAFGAVRDILRDVGFIGLPPQGATPSPPENRGAMPAARQSGKLVLFYWGPAAGNSDYGRGGVGKSRIWVYGDGRLIFLREAAIPEGANRLFTGFLEQRLRPEGAERLRSETVSAGLLAEGGEPVPFGIQIKVRSGDRLVRVERVSDLERLVARITEPASWLPASAWDDGESRAYVPSKYAVCYGGGPELLGLARILSVLPRPAADLLRAKESKEQGAGGFYCSDATTEEARALAVALERGSVQGGSGDDRGPARAFRLEYVFDVPGTTTAEQVSVFFEPYLPHGEWTCSPCG